MNINYFSTPCPSCHTGKVTYCNDDWTGGTWIAIYECDTCKKQFV